MKTKNPWSRPGIRRALWVALCFGLTSAAYLSWLDRLIRLTGPGAADWFSMVAGYLLQAAGLGLIALRTRRDSSPERTAGDFRLSLLVFAVSAALALLTPSPFFTVAFGLVMNLACGAIAGGYLRGILAARPQERGLAFGGGYALSSAAVGLLSLAGGSLLRSRFAPAAYLLLTLLLAEITRRGGFLTRAEAPEAEPVQAKANRKLPLLLAGATVLLTCLVKNLGFSFPSSDLKDGLLPELSRIAYAAGLLAAGWIGDRDRKNGLAATVAALLLPFLMLTLRGEAVPRAVCWALDYFFYGFFSVYRAVLFVDLAEEARRPELAPLGLLLGRLGDAAGSALALLLDGRTLPLIVTAAALFIPAVFLCFRLWQQLYAPAPAASPQKSEQEVFEAFCLHNDISAREREVLRLLLDNHPNGEIAEALFISENTVKYHVRNLLQKTGCRNRGELQRKYTLALYPHLEAASGRAG